MPGAALVVKIRDFYHDRHGAGIRQHRADVDVIEFLELPDKTFIGTIERGFDFPGYHFSPAGLDIAKQTITNFIEKASRLYEQERSAVSAATALEMYVRRWVQWTIGGLMIPHAVPANDEPPVEHGWGSGGDWQIPQIKTSFPD